MMTEKIREKLASEALQARKNAYAPYSGFLVGAALFTKDGKIFTGCNIENAAYSPSCCAERTAIYQAVSRGNRDFAAIAIAGGPKEAHELKECPPCGVCRQVMKEFCGADFEIILAVSEHQYTVHTLGELLPLGFSL